MTRLIVATALIVVAAYFFLKDPIYAAIARGQASAEAAAPDYTTPEAWAIRPVEQPAGAWATPWGVDVLLLPGPSGVTNGDALAPIDSEDVQAQTLDAIEPFLAAASAGGPIYAPYLRWPSAALGAHDADTHPASADALAAFEQYLAEDNLGRGLILMPMTGGEGAAMAIFERIRGDDDLRQRFGGVVALQSQSVAAVPPRAQDACSLAFEGACVSVIAVRNTDGILSWLAPNLPGAAHAYISVDDQQAAEVIAERATTLSTWLDANAPKPAEPLEGFEVIDIAPVRRPGEVD